MAFINLINLPLIFMDYRQQQQLNRNRIFRDQSNPFELNDKYFVQLFRLNKICTAELIDNLRNHLPPFSRAGGLTPENRIFTSLRFFAQGGYQLSVGQDKAIPMSQKSVSNCIETVTNAINDHLARTWIKFPFEEAEQIRGRRIFYEKYGMTGIIGVIDGTHIAIVAPPVHDPLYPEHLYLNRKQFHSINTQIVVDANSKIININALYPGSTHDSFVWRNSQLKATIQRLYNERRWVNTWLLGDSGYPLEPWLMTPINNAQEDTPEMRYNTAHKTTRACVERTIGLLKSRWRCLLRHRTLHYKPPKATKIINACAVLHNICVENNIELHADDIIENLNDEVDHQHFPNNNDQRMLFIEGNRIRNRIVATY